MKRNHGNQNSISHGIFSRVLLRGNAFGKDREYFVELVSILRDSIQPVGSLEQMLVEKLAILYLRLGRLYRADAKAAREMFKRVAADLKSDHASVECKLMSHEDQVLVIARSPTFDVIIRYESNLERQIERTFRQIEALQRMRIASAAHALPPAAIEASDGAA